MLLISPKTKPYLGLKVVAALILAGTLTSFLPKEKEEGMYPLAQLHQVDLKAAGLQIPVSEVYNPGGVSLTNALVRLGGCTGSFISETGLIITNHHCVFSAVAGHSSSEHNYLDEGFYAKDTSEELKTTIPCRITTSFEDVSDKVLQGIDVNTSADERKKTIAKNIKEITAAEEKAHPDREIQISEMHVGKYYTLFRYKLLEDVRLVYVPPKAIGKFGGESDNWMWPRHNGDFSVVRVYENGKPFKPERFIQVNAGGTSENDFVFIMGYPGRTYRHMPAEYLNYQQDYLLPIIADWFDKRIEILEADAGDDTDTKLRYAGRIASLSNVTKNFKGKMQGFRRTDVIEQRQNIQNELRAKCTQEENAVFDDIEKYYSRINALATDVVMGNQILSASGVFYTAAFIAKYSDKLAAMSGAERKEWLEKNHESLVGEYARRYRIVNRSVDLKNFANGLAVLDKRGSELGKLVSDMLKLESPNASLLEAHCKKMWEKTKFADVTTMRDLLNDNPAKFFKQGGKLVEIAGAFQHALDPKATEWSTVNTEIDALLPQLATLKEKYTDELFIPDANGTLRLTYGYIKGFEPSDAVYNDPFTTVDGIIEKAQPSGDYYMPEYLLEKYRQTEPADALRHPKKNSVVAGMLYNMDTTGGNSGSPILNAKGELVGVNFDRAYSATINDFAWNESYSRSIGVDIRYVLFVMKYMHEADALLDEMNVSL